MLELGGIRSQRQSRQRPVLLQPALSSVPNNAAAAASAPLSALPLPSFASSSSSSRKRPLPSDASLAASSQQQQRTTRIKLERDRGEKGWAAGVGLGPGMGSGASSDMELGRVDDKRLMRERRDSGAGAAVRASVPFVAIRQLRQQSRQRREEQAADAARETEAETADERSSGPTERSDSGVALVEESGRPSAAGVALPPPLLEPSVVVVERLYRSPVEPALLSSSSSAAHFPASSCPNFKRFHKTSFGRPSSVHALHRSPSQLHPSAVHLVVADSGNGCAAAVEVEAVRLADHIELLTAQMDGTFGHGRRDSSSSSVSVTGKRKR